MYFIQQNAEESVRNMLRQISLKHGLQAVDRLAEVEYMDDGSPIRLTVTIDRERREAVFDFSGTGYEVLSNINCPRSVVMSAIIYCLRCMVDSDIPLNQGCLNPIRCLIPQNSLLSPGESAPIGKKWIRVRESLSLKFFIV